MENTQKVLKFRKLVKENLYPFLLNNSESIEDAKMMCSVASMTVRQALLEIERKMKVSDLELPKVDEKYKKYEELLGMFGEESVFDTARTLDDMAQTIDGFIREENTKRKLDSLKADLLDYENLDS